MKGALSQFSKLSVKEVLDIRERWANRDKVPVNSVMLSIEYDITPRNVTKIIKGESWAHVGGPRASGDLRKVRIRALDEPPPNFHNSVDRKAVLRLMKHGLQQVVIAERLGVTHSAIAYHVKALRAQGLLPHKEP